MTPEAILSDFVSARGRALPRLGAGFNALSAIWPIAEVDAGVFTGQVRSREDAIELARKPRAG